MNFIPDLDVVMIYKEPIKDAKRRFRRVYASEADRLAAEEAERKAEKEIFDREWSKARSIRIKQDTARI